MDRLKKTRGQGRKSLQDKLEQQGQGGYKKDDRIWKYTWKETDGQLLSFNTIRFLTTPLVDIERQEKGDIAEDIVLSPCALSLRHYFKGSGGAYSETSPQTFGLDCPVREHDRPLWSQQKETKDENLKDILVKRIPKKEYYANIQVISDESNPENNGKIFLFKFGDGIKKIIDKASKPTFPTDPKIDDVFCMYDGAELTLNFVGRKSSFNGNECIVPEYKDSQIQWGQSCPIAETDEEMEEIWKKAYSLYDFVDPTKVKDFATLEERLRKVLAIPEGAPLVPVANKQEANVGSAPPQQKTASDMAKDEGAPQASDVKTENKEEEADEPQTQTPPQSDDKDDGIPDMDDFERMLAMD